MKFSTALLLPCLLLANCATIVSHSQYPVTLNSNPAGATVRVKNREGVVIHQATTPATVTLKSSAGYFQPASYEVEFSKKGYPTQKLEFTANMNGWYLGNVIFGGLIGLVIVDPATGAMWRLDDSLNANLTPLATLSTEDGKQLKIVDRRQLPAGMEQKLIAMN